VTRTLLLTSVLWMLGTVTAAGAQDVPSRVDRAQALQLPAPTDSTRSVEGEMIRRRVELLARSGRIDDAIAMILEQRKNGVLPADLERRLTRLYRDGERWAELEELLMQGNGGRERELDIGQLRMLAEARYALGRPEQGRAVLDRILASDPQDVSLARLVSNVLSQRGRTQEAIDVLLQTRKRLKAPLEFAQLLGTLHADMGDVRAATREYCRTIVSSPLNVAIMRGQVLDLADAHPQKLGDMQAAADDVVREHPEIPQLKIVVAELLLRRGDDQKAWRTLAPLMNEQALEQEMLRLSLAGLSDSRLPGADPMNSLRRLRLSARLARGLLANETLPVSLQPRVTDALVRSQLAMLENPAFASLPEAEQSELLDETRRSILDMQTRYSGNELTAAALLRLAAAYVDGLHRPQDAIQLYEHLSVNPNATREHVKLARLGLGRSYVAAGDTARAREVFYVIGQDMEFPQGQGRAQFHLGMIDFMGGAFETAADRFKAVAMEQPIADYTNDALDLALVLTEFELSGQEDDAPLRTYGRALYLRATHETAALQAALESVAEGEPAPIRERSRLELARLARERGNAERAMQWARRVSAEAPESRYAANALDLEGELLEQLGRTDQATKVYERLLLDHDDYVMIDRVRDRLRELRITVGAEEGEIP
jgi:tetratricopeptide (TPR) repeat protein